MEPDRILSEQDQLPNTSNVCEQLFSTNYFNENMTVTSVNWIYSRERYKILPLSTAIDNLDESKFKVNLSC